MTYRAIVTGSRTWRDWELIHNQLAELAHKHPDLLVVHGACPTGADRMADTWANTHGVPTEPHPARDFGDWPGCGPLRNAHMIALGADICLAFITRCESLRCRCREPHPSHGATNCAALAQLAGIPVSRWRA